MQTKYHSFQKFKSAEYSIGNKGKVATQLMRLYRTVITIHKPVILELGTGKGESTTVFLQACEEMDGKLVSVDIMDCSDLSDFERWTFLKTDSRDVEHILSEAPWLKNGIDILYIDSYHKKEQVESELLGWYPYMKENSHIFFDDVDANPYRKGNRKDHYGNEKDWNEIKEYVKSFFHTHEDELYLDIMYGSTGLAHFYKLSPLGSEPKNAVPIHHRKINVFNELNHIFKTYIGKIKRRMG